MEDKREFFKEIEMSILRSSFSQQSSIMELPNFDKIKTKPLYGKKTFFWELESIEQVMADGVQKAITCDFEIGHASFSYTNGSSSNSRSTLPHSKWRLSLDLVDIEPAITVEKVHPTDKVHYFKISVRVMKNPREEADIMSFPNDNLFYESNPTDAKWGRLEPRKFTLHKQLDYGCSYTSWLKDVLVEESLLLKVDFETCQSSSAHQME